VRTLGRVSWLGSSSAPWTGCGCGSARMEVGESMASGSGVAGTVAAALYTRAGPAGPALPRRVPSRCACPSLQPMRELAAAPCAPSHCICSCPVQCDSFGPWAVCQDARGARPSLCDQRGLLRLLRLLAALWSLCLSLKIVCGSTWGGRWPCPCGMQIRLRLSAPHRVTTTESHEASRPEVTYIIYIRFLHAAACTA